MALKIDYVVGETVSNFRRNFWMATAAILTVAVSLSLVGGALLVRQGVTKATVQWRGGAELSVFMKPDATQQQIDAVGAELKNLPEVKSFNYVDKPAAYKEAQTLFASQPDTLSSLSVDAMPTSYRVVPNKSQNIESIGDRLKPRPGVSTVAYAKDAIRNMELIARGLQIGLLIVAVVLLASASLLILNAIRIAIFARRREVSVMKLVGATNWFIRIPFMLEGLLQGLIGAAVAFGLVMAGRQTMAQVAASHNYRLLSQMVVTVPEAIGTGVLVLFVGVVVGAGGAAAAVHRFLDT
jgi:cell division transport system permease protein